MENYSILKADYLNIIFNNRNKEYGAYLLRKTYSQRLGNAFLFCILGLTAICCLSFVLINNKKIVDKKLIKPIDLSQPALLPQIPKNKIIEPQATNMAKPKIKCTKSTDIEVVPDELVTDSKKISENFSKISTGITNNNDTGNDIIIGVKDGQVIKEAIVIPKKEEIRRWVDQMPKFSGDITEYLNKHLIYPDKARENGIQGQVVIQFIINENGEVSGATVVRGIGSGCDDEAMKIVMNMPKWKPGTLNGNPVKVYMKLPIMYVLN